MKSCDKWLFWNISTCHKWYFPMLCILGYTEVAVVMPQCHRIAPNFPQPNPCAGCTARGIREFIGRRIRKKSRENTAAKRRCRDEVKSPISPIRFESFCPSNRNSMSYSPTYQSHRPICPEKRNIIVQKAGQI